MKKKPKNSGIDFPLFQNNLKLKLTTLLLLVAMFNIRANTYAQTKVNLDLNNTTVETVLETIEQKTDFRFIYKINDVDLDRIISIHIKNKPIDVVLDNLFKGTSTDFKVKDTQIILKKPVVEDKETLIRVKQTLKGKVTDERRSPLPGVNIIKKGTKIGAITDADGIFSIDASEGDVLVFKLIGYEDQERKVTNDAMVVILKLAITKMDEVVVIGYGTSKKKDLTGSVASLKPGAIDAAKALSVDNLLQGKIAGVSVSSSVATPGAAASVTIRGANSLRGDNQPLYVIDNIPQASTGQFAGNAFGGGDFQIAQNPLGNLSPSDIEDIQILKDASATAIYGSRGANGVIIITTKKGKTGAAKISASANYTIADATRLRKMMNLDEYANYRNEISGATAQQYFKEGDETRYIFSGAVYNANDPLTYNVITGRNWQKESYRSAFSQNYAMSLNGGSEAIKYFLSTDYKNIEGLIQKTGIQQGGLRLNLNGNLSKSVKLNVSMSSSLKKNNMMSGGDTRGGVTGSIARTAIDAAPFAIPDNDPILASSPEAKTSLDGWLNDYDDITLEKSFRASADLTWKISKNFSYNVRTGGNMMIQNRDRWYGLSLFKGQNDNGSLGLTNLNSNNYTVENLLNFNRSLGKVLDISATAGVTYDEYKWLNKITAAKGFDVYSLRTKGLHLATVINEMQPIQQDYQLLSYLGRLNLSFYEGRYLATITARADGSSKFNIDNRWAMFPSFSLAWRLEKEPFMKDASWVDQLKIRTGFGMTGSQSVSPYNSFFDYGRIIDYAGVIGDKQLAFGVSRLQNSGLKWETTSAYNTGVDFSFWNGRLSGSLESYYKETDDLLIERALAPSTSFASITTNQGSLSNQGFEISLSSDIVKNKNVTWSVSGNIGFNKSKIMNLGFPEAAYGNERYKAYLGNSIGDHFGPTNIFIVGKAPGLFWGYKTDGIIQTGETSATGLPTSSKFVMTPGNIRVVDVTGDGIIDDKDKTIIGNPNPDFTYGFQTSLKVKDLTLSASFNGVQGGQVFNGNSRYERMPSQQTGNLTSEAYANAWRAGAPNNLYPSLTSQLKNEAYDRYVEDGSFLRCSDITLGYALPENMVKKAGFATVNIFASAKNMFLITKYSGYDPEMRTFSFDGLRPGIDLNSYSNPRQFVFGLNVGF